MPSTSAKQAKFMRAVANNPKFAKKVGVKQSVGKDFEMADKKMKKYSAGGKPAKDPVTGGRDTVPMDEDRKKFLERMRKQNEEARKSSARSGSQDIQKAKGGKVMKKSDKAGRALVKKSADTMGRAMVKKMAKGGLAAGHKSANGIAKKGLTKGKEVAMKRGGKC